MEGVLCLPNVLLSALPAIDQVDHVPCLAGGHSSYVECLVSGCTSKMVPVWIWLQVRQRLVPQGLLPLASWSPAGLSSALIKRSRRFFGRR